MSENEGSENITSEFEKLIELIKPQLEDPAKSKTIIKSLKKLTETLESKTKPKKVKEVTVTEKVQEKLKPYVSEKAGIKEYRQLAEKCSKVSNVTLPDEVRKNKLELMKWFDENIEKFTTYLDQMKIDAEEKKSVEALI